MKPYGLFLLFAICGSSVACATDPVDDDLVSIEVPADTGDAKADQAALPFTVVDGLSLRSTVGNTEEGRVIRSSVAFKSAFGIAPPAGLDFATEWLAVYSGGVRRTGGFSASITRIALSDSGATVKVSAHLTVPGPACIVTQALTKPIAVVRFPAQHGASRSRFAKLTETNPCTPAVCGPALATVLGTAVQGILFPSESDFPYEVLSFGQAGPPTITTLRGLVHPPAGTTVEQRSFDALFDRLTTPNDPGDPASEASAAQYRALRATLEANLHGLTVIRVGQIHIDVYILGLSGCGELFALKTVSIET